MGITYHALDVNLGSTVALKVISARYSIRRSAQRFGVSPRRRAVAASDVASVFRFGETASGQCFYAMELIEGETLETRVRRDGPLPARRRWSRTRVARALMAAESHKLVHRDLKPSNLMVLAMIGRRGFPGGQSDRFRPGQSRRRAANASDLHAGFLGLQTSPVRAIQCRKGIARRAVGHLLVRRDSVVLLCGRAFHRPLPAELDDHTLRWSSWRKYRRRWLPFSARCWRSTRPIDHNRPASCWPRSAVAANRWQQHLVTVES